MAHSIKAILFDVFGTVTDVPGSLTATLEHFGAVERFPAKWAELAKAWVTNNQSALEPVRKGKRPWTEHGTLQREALDRLAPKFKAKNLTPSDRDMLTFAWHFLTPWPDAVPALHRLKAHFILGAFSNGTVRQMVDIAKFGGLPWDVIFGADMFRTYKPDPKLYLGAAKLLHLEPKHILLVAAHNQDLEAAGKLGLQTCFVHRATEDAEPKPGFTYVVNDFEELARRLGAISN